MAHISNLKKLSLSLIASASMLPCLAYAAEIGSSLQDAMDNAIAGEALEVIVSFHGEGPLTETQIDIFENMGVSGLTLQALPIAGILATPDQILELDNNPDIRSLWLNEELTFDNEAETLLTGVDRLRADRNLRNEIGLPYSGKGIGVLINDSGVDGQHPDLKNNIVQNVAAQFNLRSYSDLLPITWVEDVPDTDIAGGHGSHVAGTVGGTGAASAGREEGVAPGVDLIGYGSGAGLFILDTLGAFDYALVNQTEYNIRVVANSFGSTGDTGTDFNPDDPTNIATKKLTDRGVIVVISAGNSGSGEGTITGNFKKAPWIITVGAGNNQGQLAEFSSRGRRDTGGLVQVDGEMLEWKDQPTIVAPGVDVISVRSKSDPLSAPDIDPTNGTEDIFYQTSSGTSMASPHISGVVALMLEANPNLDWRDVKNILQQTATNIPGRESWEVGAGYVNAQAAVTMAAGLRRDYGRTVIQNRDFRATFDGEAVAGPNVTLSHNPVGEKQVETFTVPDGLATVSASANVGDNTVAIVLRDPEGNRYGSSISLPVLGQNIAVTAPAIPGEWTVELGGIGSVSGVALDPLGVTNGTAVPLTDVDVNINFFQINGYTGLPDIEGHPAQGLIEKAIAERLMDSRASEKFHPDANINRREVASYLTLGGAIRQFRDNGGFSKFTDQTVISSAFSEAVTERGAALRDLDHSQDGVMKAEGDRFDGGGKVRRHEIAYTLVQTLGLQEVAEIARQELEGRAITVAFGDDQIPLADDQNIPSELRGYVQLALDLQLMPAQFQLSQGPFDLEPKVHASFGPDQFVTRADYAFYANNLFDRLNQATD